MLQRGLHREGYYLDQVSRQRQRQIACCLHQKSRSSGLRLRSEKTGTSLRQAAFTLHPRVRHRMVSQPIRSDAGLVQTSAGKEGCGTPGKGKVTVLQDRSGNKVVCCLKQDGTYELRWPDGDRVVKSTWKDVLNTLDTPHLPLLWRVFPLPQTAN